MTKYFPPTNRISPAGKTFLIICFGQLISIFGTTMTQFALGIWVFQKTGEAGAYAVLGAVYLGIMILFGPFSGILVDRWNRKLVLIISDLMAGVLTILIFLLFHFDKMEVIYLFIITGITGVFSSFQWIAFSTTIPLLVKTQNLTRANSVLGLVESLATIIAPISAAILLPVVNISGILIIDIITFILAVSGLFLIAVPNNIQDDQSRTNSYLSDFTSGWKYLLKKKDLVILQLYLFSSNFFSGLIQGVLFPMILIYTNNDELIVGQVGSALGLGALAGGILISIWGGPKNLIKGTLIGLFLGHIAGLLLLGNGNTIYTWIIGAFILTLFSPLASNCVQSIWQKKVETTMQGRVFGIRRLISGPATPLGMITGGFLADKIFEPYMQSNDLFKFIFGRIVGTSHGSGMSLVILLAAIFGSITVSSGFMSKRLMNIEKNIHNSSDYLETPCKNQDKDDSSSY